MINDYASLQAAVADWLARADLSAKIPNLIQMAELRIQDDLDSVLQLTTITGTTVNGRYVLPEDFDDAVSLTLSIGGQDVPVQPLTVNDGKRMDIAGLPVGYYISTSLEDPPSPVPSLVLNLSGGADYAFSLTYYGSFPALSDSNLTNWLLLTRPNIYLYATLLEATPFIQDDARIAIWADGYKTAIDAYNLRGDRSRFGVGSVRRVDFHAP